MAMTYRAEPLDYLLDMPNSRQVRIAVQALAFLIGHVPLAVSVVQGEEIETSKAILCT